MGKVPGQSYLVFIALLSMGKVPGRSYLVFIALLSMGIGDFRDSV